MMATILPKPSDGDDFVAIIACKTRTRRDHSVAYDGDDFAARLIKSSTLNVFLIVVFEEVDDCIKWQSQ